MKKERQTLSLELDIDVHVLDLPEISRVHTELLKMLVKSPLASDHLQMSMKVIPATLEAPHAIYVSCSRRLRHKSVTPEEFAKHVGVAVVTGLGPKFRHVGVDVIAKFGLQPHGSWERKARKR